jgi:hypothetical protein
MLLVALKRLPVLAEDTKDCTQQSSQIKKLYKEYYMDINDLNNRFTFHSANPVSAALYEEIRGKAREYALWLNSVLPEGRDKSLAITHLEEVVFWSNASVARD